MKKTIITIALRLSLVTLCLYSCKKKETITPTPTSTQPQTATMDVEFFVDANKYQIREPLIYPQGSPTFTDLANPFSPLGSNNICTTTGKKINIKYFITDSTIFTFWFFKNATPSDTYKGTCTIHVSKTGNVILSYANAPGSGITPYFANCKNAVVLN